MMGNAVFTLAHISDLHFSQGTDQSDRAHTHSIDHLVALERALRARDPVDLLIVTGDISNHGDKQSLINASAYIFETIPIGKEEHTGLRFAKRQTGIVPGNHDAWNVKRSGPFIDRRQKALEHYNYAFPSHQIAGDIGCYYDWIQKGDSGIYLAFVDSCFLGDTEAYRDSPFGTIRYDQAIAKGRLTIRQTEKLLEWHDLGYRGALENPRDSASRIGSDVFARSLKIVVMHHYLFEPPEHGSDYFMRIEHRNVVFRNIAFCDFDILLCGHKHLPGFDTHTYGYHFDRRATSRYLINYFRRLIGLHSLPIQLRDDEGRRFSRRLSMVANMLVKLVRRSDANADAETVAKVALEHLRGGLDDPDSLEENLTRFLREQGVSGSEVLERSEIREIQKRIAIGLTIEERRRLAPVARRILKKAGGLRSRGFLQIMSGSSAKAGGLGRKPRSFNMYEMECEGGVWKVRCDRYSWDPGERCFGEKPLEQVATFPKSL